MKNEKMEWLNIKMFKLQEIIVQEISDRLSRDGNKGSRTQLLVVRL
jgi:hypothetical protein